MTTEESVTAGQHPKHCPECQKKGVKKKVKPFHINLEEEVRECCVDRNDINDNDDAGCVHV